MQAGIYKRMYVRLFENNLSKVLQKNKKKKEKNASKLSIHFINCMNKNSLEIAEVHFGFFSS